MNIFDLATCALAANSIATAWFYGSLFDRPRDYFKTRKGLLAELMTCPLCLSFHIAFWTVVLLWLPGVFLWEPWTTVTRVPLYGFAVTTLIHYMQGILPLEEDDDGEPERETDEAILGREDDSEGAEEVSRRR